MAIRQNSQIKGIVIAEEETKLLQFVDDTTVTLSYKSSPLTLFKILDIFKSIAGLKIN